MPVMLDEYGEEAVYICDVCNGEIEYPSGAMCPVCGRLFCDNCLCDHPFETVEVMKNGPDYKKHELMCDICLAIWRKRHPNFEEPKLDAYLRS